MSGTRWGMTIPIPSDYHVHLRQGNMLKLVGPLTDASYGRALVMPNTLPCDHWGNGICNAKEVEAYRKEIKKVLKHCEPLMTIKLTEDTTPEMIRQAKRVNVTAVKLYPKGVTSHSDNGIPLSSLSSKIPTKLHEVFSAIQEERLVLCMHGEMPGNEYHSFDSPYESWCKINGIVQLSTKNRTGAFCAWIIDTLIPTFPKMAKVIEHITTRYEVETIRQLWKQNHKIAGTITPHHLHLTIEDLISDKLKPHLFCKPIAKHEEDRLALVDAATSGESCFFLGTDSAPHLIKNKECSDCCAGIFNATTAIPYLINLFLSVKKSENIIPFTSANGDNFYEMPTQQKSVVYLQVPWVVPKTIGEVVKPFLAEQTLDWALDPSNGMKPFHPHLPAFKP